MASKTNVISVAPIGSLGGHADGTAAAEEGKTPRVAATQQMQWEPNENGMVMAFRTNLLRPLLPWRWAIVNPLGRKFCWFGPYCGVTGFSIGELLVTLFIGLLVGLTLGSWGGEAGTSGSIATIPMALAFATVPHNSFLTVLIGIPFERTLIYHKMFAWLSVILGVLHGIIAMSDEGEWNLFDGANASGSILTLAMAALILTSLPWIRRKLFEVFIYAHWILFSLAAVAGFAHGAGAFVFGAVFFAFDVLLRLLLVRWYTRPATVQLARLPADVVRIEWQKKGFQYKAGQYVFVLIPELSWLQLHPFSISSSPQEDTVRIHVRVLGDWTKKLHDLASTKKEVTAFIDGPVGELGVDLEGSRYKHVLLVSGGIGITPMQSICNSLLDQHARGRPLKKVWFVWSVRDRYLVDAMLDHDGATKIAKQSMEAKEDAKATSSSTHTPVLPYSFSPSLLRDQKTSIAINEHGDVASNVEEEVLHTEFYLTRARSVETFDAGGINPQVQECLLFDRPDLQRIFAQMASIAKGKPVAVLGCGPAAMIKQLQKLCHERKFANFDVHTELFEF
mmetsp:Transcript_26152/g.57296  ORF Transcript_26152/g.57296 Transcript_26152/m.57296 type:complete len:563 (-) Transcript_26152:177-1865(-)